MAHLPPGRRVALVRTGCLIDEAECAIERTADRTRSLAREGDFASAVVVLVALAIGEQMLIEHDAGTHAGRLGRRDFFDAGNRALAGARGANAVCAGAGERIRARGREGAEQRDR